MATMKSLIGLINKIQRACTVLGDHGGEGMSLWEALPTVAVVGGQSSGKSSVLKSVVGRDFLPRGSGIVTRRPLVLQLHKTEEGTTEYAEFLHAPRKRFADFAAVRKEIEDETDRITGKSKQISNIPIQLSIYSPNVVNLTLIDLPGLTKVAVEGQPVSIVQDIENMVRSYVEKPNCIILALSPANQDIATSDAIKLAREVDPTGERTFGVATKLDIMDKGTDCLDVLEGRSYHLQHPWVGIVNRSQADINKRVDMIAARRKEREYFETGPEYGHLASRMGSEYLAKLLSQHLETVIRQKIPSIVALINKSIDEINAELDRIRRPIAVDSGEHLDGGRPGGDRIYGVFDHQLPADLKKLPFDRHLSTKNVQKVVSEADGYQPHLIAPEQGYRRLIDGSISYFKGPAEATVDAGTFCIERAGQKVDFRDRGEKRPSVELKRFPTLAGDIAAASNEALERFRDKSRKTVLRLVDMESSYLTVDFFRKLHLEPEKEKPNARNAPQPNADIYSDSHFRKIRSNVSAYINMVCDTLRNSLPRAVVYCQRSLLNFFYVQVGRKEKDKLGGMLDEDPQLMERRGTLAKRLELYKQARDDIDAVAWKPLSSSTGSESQRTMEESQELALTQLRTSVEKLASSTEGYEKPTLMRFLVARSMNPDNAAKMFVDWQKWRASMVPPNGIPESEVRDELEFGKICLQGPTKSGHPLVLVLCSKHFPAKNAINFKKFVVYVLDKTIASGIKDKEVGDEKLVAVFDLANITYKNLDARGLITSFQFLQSYYPERLAKCYMLHMPGFFVSVWRFVCRFLEKSTQEKIVIVTDGEEEIKFKEEVGVDALPEEYGGRAKLALIQDVLLPQTAPEK
ncbi:hypothetical protein Bca101_044179 [Brassica carinata]